MASNLAPMEALRAAELPEGDDGQFEPNGTAFAALRGATTMTELKELFGA